MEKKLEVKFETKESDIHPNRYGCYNNDMKCFQYIYDWHGATHSDFGVAMLMTKELNDKHDRILTNPKG